MPRIKEEKITVTLRGKNQLTLPANLVQEGVRRFYAAVDRKGRVILDPILEIPASQAYFWTKRWQEGERQSDQDAAAGRIKGFKDVEALITDLKH
jgi:hypothetical protein